MVPLRAWRMRGGNLGGGEGRVKGRSVKGGVGGGKEVKGGGQDGVGVGCAI